LCREVSFVRHIDLQFQRESLNATYKHELAVACDLGIDDTTQLVERRQRRVAD